MSSDTNTGSNTEALAIKARRGQRAIMDLKAAYDRECGRRLKALRKLEELAFQSLDEQHLKGADLLRVEASIDPEHTALIANPTAGLTVQPI